MSCGRLFANGYFCGATVKTSVMRGTDVKDEYFASCPIRNILSRVASKWSLIVLHTLSEDGTMRFNALQRKIPDISQKMLTSTLRTLAADGFVSRRVYAEVPPRVEYALTERAMSFMECADVLTKWAYGNMSAIMKDRERACASGQASE